MDLSADVAACTKVDACGLSRITEVKGVRPVETDLNDVRPLRTRMPGDGDIFSLVDEAFRSNAVSRFSSKPGRPTTFAKLLGR
jgi:hypothetical protein